MPPPSRSLLDLSWLGASLARLGARLKAMGGGAPDLAPLSPLAAFHCADGRDHAGRSHEEILAFSDEELERVHDFIQWLFPLPEPSQAFYAAPLLTPEDLAVMNTSNVCQARLEAAVARMSEFLANNPQWLEVFDHNHLRITRMIRASRLIGGDGMADGLREFLLDHATSRGAQINTNTLAFWQSA